MTIHQACNAIENYCKREIPNFRIRADLAVDKAWREHIPCDCADPFLADEINDKIEEWCEDHDCPSFIDDITADDIILTS